MRLRNKSSLEVSDTVVNGKNPESHVLVINDRSQICRVLLQSAIYSIGRSKQSSIVISSKAISRQHALLVRIAIPEQDRYCYRIIDGNTSGQPSLNGVTVNDVKCQEWDLKSGDTILLGPEVSIEYQVINLSGSSDSSDYLKPPSTAFDDSAPIDPYQTLINMEDATAPKMAMIL